MILEREGENYRVADQVDNQKGNTDTNVEVDASLQDEATTRTAIKTTSQTPVRYEHGADGNLFSGESWHYEWNGENRLARMYSRQTLDPENRKQLDFAYDGNGRRIEKIVSHWDKKKRKYKKSHQVTFAYDGWNMIGELQEQGKDSDWKTYLWGLDLSYTPHGAGGVGGLISITVPEEGGAGKKSQETQTWLSIYDGNGNITGLLSTESNEKVANYTYNPFGELLRVSGPAADGNGFRFSTKCSDVETRLIYYGYRYYCAQAGRWLNRDPIAEKGGNNLFASFEGDPVSKVDSYGLACRGISFQSLSVGHRGRVGPLGWRAEVRGYINTKECDTCCGKKDDVVEIGLDGQASLDGASYRARFVSGGYGVSFWGGVQARVGAGGKAQAVFKSDKCSGRELSGSVCLSVRGFGTLGGGGVATIQWGYTIWRVGAELVGTGSIEFTKCYSCNNGSCGWGNTKVCLSGDLSFNARLGIGGVSYGLWNDSSCFEL